MAHAMAARMAGHWRDPEAVDRWADEIAHELVASRT